MLISLFYWSKMYLEQSKLNVIVPRLGCEIRFMLCKHFFNLKCKSSYFNVTLSIPKSLKKQKQQGELYLHVHSIQRSQELEFFEFFSTDSGSPAVFRCFLAQYSLQSILTRCPVPAGQKWPTAWSYTITLHCRYGVFKVWAAWDLHLWILFKSSTLVSSHHKIFSRSALCFLFLPTWFFLSNGFFCTTTTPCRPELLIWLTLCFILSYWTLWILQSDFWPFASLVLWRFKEQASALRLAGLM